MNYLFILGTYLPRPSANGICINNISDNLVCAGNTVVILCTKKHYDKHDYEVINGAHIYRIAVNRFYEHTQKLKENRKSIPGKLLLKTEDLIRKLFTLLSKSFWLAAYGGRGRKTYETAKTLHKKYRFDMVVCVYSPFEALTAGCRLKKKFQEIQYIPCFFDALSGGFKAKGVNTKHSLNKKLKIEKRLVFNADRIIYMKANKTHCEKFFLNEPFYKNIKYLNNPLIIKPERLIKSAVTGIRKARDYLYRYAYKKRKGTEPLF